MEEKLWQTFWHGMAVIAVPMLAAVGMLWAKHQSEKSRTFDPNLARYKANLKRRLKL